MGNPQDDEDDFSFGDSDMDEGDEEGQAESGSPPSEEQAPYPVVQAPDPSSPVPDEEAEDLDLERDLNSRLEVAQLYQQVLSQGLIAADTLGAKQVSREIKRFVQERLRALMGMQGQQVATPVSSGGFSPADVTMLKQLAEKGEYLLALAARAQERQGGSAVVKPGIVPVRPAAPPPPVTKVVPVQAKPAPQPAPQPAKQSAPPQRQQPPPQAQPQRPQPKAPTKVAAPPGAKQPTAAERERIDPQYRENPTLRYRDGQWFVQVRDADDRPLFVYDVKTKKKEPMLKNVTLPARPQGAQPVPMPNMADAAAWDATMSQHAEKSVVTMADSMNQMKIIGGRGADSTAILLSAGFVAANSPNNRSEEDEENRP